MTLTPTSIDNVAAGDIIIDFTPAIFENQCHSTEYTGDWNLKGPVYRRCSRDHHSNGQHLTVKQCDDESQYVVSHVWDGA